MLGVKLLIKMEGEVLLNFCELQSIIKKIQRMNSKEEPGCRNRSVISHLFRVTSVCLLPQQVPMFQGRSMRIRIIGKGNIDIGETGSRNIG